MSETDFEREQEDAAAQEACAIGGEVSSQPRPAGGEVDPAMEPVTEAGGGESEGFEESERQLIEHASHGDQHAVPRVLQNAPAPEETDEAWPAAVGDPGDAWLPPAA